MLKRSLPCLLLALSLLFGTAAQAVKWDYPASAHPGVDYAGMLPVTSFEEDDLQAALKELEGLCSRHSRDREDKETRQRVSGLYYRVLSEMNELITKANLASVQYDASGGAEDAAALYLELSAQQTRLYDQCYRVFAAMAASPYRDILDDSAGDGAADSLLGYEGLTEDLTALYEEEDRLVQAYDRIMSKGVSVSMGGGVWTEEALRDAEVDPETRQAIREALDTERNRAAGEVYRQLLQLRNKIAAQSGYDNYTEYAYTSIYNRDYEPEDIQPIREAAKTYILPLQLRLLEELDQQELRALSVRSRKSGEEVLDAIQPFIQGFDKEMGETFAFMRAHRLYDIEYGADKLATGYTVALPAYGSAFIFNAPYGDYQDYSDTIHEFGHFNETFHCTQHDLWADFNIDVGEIHSQALELMFTSYAGELFGERYGAVYADIILCNILDSILDGCLYDEFQTAAYEDPELTVEEMDRLFKTLSEEYGYFYEPGVEADPSWVENAHSFQSPLYFISYATSALSALDLWTLYLEAPRQARDIYLELSALSFSLPYGAAIEEVGLRDIFEPDTIPELAEELEHHLDGENISRHGKPSTFAWADFLPYVLSFSFLLLMLWLRSRDPKWVREDKRRHDALDPWNVKEKKPPWEF